jgi:hypothetical protein
LPKGSIKTDPAVPPKAALRDIPTWEVLDLSEKPHQIKLIVGALAKKPRSA